MDLKLQRRQKDRLRNQEYWKSIQPSGWCLTGYDKSLLDKDDTSTKEISHTYLSQDLSILKQSSDEEVSKEAEKLSKVLKKSYKDKENVEFWKKVGADSLLSRAVTETVSLALLNDNKRRREGMSDSGSNSTFEGDETIGKKRKVSTKYISTNDLIPSYIQFDSARWILPSIGFDVTEKLMMMHDNIVKKYNKSKSISLVETLALKYIFLITSDYTLSCTNVMVKDVHDLIVSDLKPLSIALPIKAFEWCSSVSKVCLKSDKEVQNVTIGFLCDANNTNDANMMALANVLFRLAPRVVSWNQNNVVEDTFAHNHLTDFLDVVFGSGKSSFHFEYANKKLASSSNKPDYTLSFHSQGKSLALLIIEIKAPGRNYSSNDFQKISLDLKGMLNNLIEQKVAEPETYAIHVDEWDCKFYRMSIRHEAIYCLEELASLKLPGSPAEFISVKGIMEAFLSVKNDLNMLARRIETRIENVQAGVHDFDGIVPMGYMR